MRDASVLDNPVWYALKSSHRSLGLHYGDAARYQPHILPFAALATTAPSAFLDLAALTPPQEPVTFLTAAPLTPPPSWDVATMDSVHQLECPRLGSPSFIQSLRLGHGDLPAMLALAKRVEASPPLWAVLDLGRCQGIRERASGTLIAMAGERLRLDGFTEISPVYVDPSRHGQGYATALVSDLVSRIYERGETPIVHLDAPEVQRGFYERIGFRFRRILYKTALTRT